MLLAFRVFATLTLLVLFSRDQAQAQSDVQTLSEAYRNPIVFARTHYDKEIGEPTHNAKIWVMEEDGSRQRQLTFGVQYDDHPVLFSDQQHVLYSEFNGTTFPPNDGARLVRLDIVSGTREIYAEEKGCALHHATLSAVDDRLVYHHDCGDRMSLRVGWGPGSYEIPMAAMNGVAVGESVILMHEKNLDLPPREVALVRFFGSGENATVSFLTDDAFLNRRPAVSPDGGWMAWQTNMTGNDEVFLARIDGSERRNLTNHPALDGHPWFSRDGEWLVFESNRTGVLEIWKLDLSTLEATQLTQGDGRYASRTPRW